MEDRAQHFARKLACEIDAWDLSVALAAGENVVVIDARAPETFAREHIPGAINVPHRSMREETVRAIDRAALVVTYCDGIGCNASTKAALAMSRLGFCVKELIGGLDWWKRDGHPTHGVAARSPGEACGCN